MSKSRKRQSLEDRITTLVNGKFQVRERTFWYHQPEKNFPPPTIERIEEYDGSDRLSVACTQTNLNAGDQKKLVERWCDDLPTLEEVKSLWLVSRVPQPLFEAATQMTGLEGLYLKWGGVKDFSSISGMKNLRSLHVGSNPSLEPLEALESLKTLQWLELENIRAASDLSFVKLLPQLLGLKIAGDGNSLKYLKLKSLQPLDALKNLKWLNLEVIKVPDEELHCLSQLPKLKYLGLGNTYSMEAIADLAGRIPHVRCDLFQPVYCDVEWTVCKKCGQNSLVMVTGKGLPLLCRDCDAERIQRHVEKYEAIAAAAK